MTFEGFRLETVKVSAATLRVQYGGHGPAVLLLHGHPRTHMTWGKVAEILARSFTVVCPDLRGFGQSRKPADTPDHPGSSLLHLTTRGIEASGVLVILVGVVLAAANFLRNARASDA